MKTLLSFSVPGIGKFLDLALTAKSLQLAGSLTDDDDADDADDADDDVCNCG